MHTRTYTCTLVALLLSLCGCGKNEPPSVKPADVAKPRNSEGKDPLAGLATKKGATLQGPNTKFRALAFSADGKTLASGGYEQTLLWDLATGKQIGDLKGHEGQIAGLAFSPDGTTLVSSGEDRKIKIWDVKSKQDKETIENAGLITAFRFSPDGKTLCSDGHDNDGGGYCWDIETRKKQAALVGLRRQPDRNESRSYIYYAYSAGGDCIGASGVAPGEVFATVVEVPSRKQLVDIPKFAGKLIGVSSAAKEILCQEDSTDKLSLWDFSGKKRLDLEGQLLLGAGSTVVAFSPDGKYLVGSMHDKQYKGVLQLWDVANGKPIVALNGDHDFQSVAFSKDGQLLAAGAEGGEIKVWTVDAVVK